MHAAGPEIGRVQARATGPLVKIISFSRSSNPHSGGVSAPTSIACVVTFSRWFSTRPISE